MITCPNCKRDNEEGTKICLYCGEPLALSEQVATRSLDDTDFEEGRPHWGTARFNTRMCMIVNVRDSRDRHVFYFDEIEELVLGRADVPSGNIPDLDLNPYDAAEKGVSRRHATITRRENSLNVMDLGGPNGTFLNGQRLIGTQPRLLRDGDELRLGHLVLRISFARA